MPQRAINQIVEKRARSKDYVKKRIVKIVDARDPDVYFGVTIEPWPPTPTAGHIPTAKSLPTPWLWNLNLNATGTGAIYATYKDADTLREMASGVVGWPVFFKEIIVYCGNKTIPRVISLSYQIRHHRYLPFFIA